MDLPLPFIKIIYLMEPKPMYTYFRSTNIYKKFLNEVQERLFKTHNIPQTPMRSYWMDENGDEIEIDHVFDFEIFLAKSKDKHLFVKLCPERKPKLPTIKEEEPLEQIITTNNKEEEASSHETEYLSSTNVFAENLNVLIETKDETDKKN